MAIKQYETTTEIVRVHETLELRDPHARTILIGSAAVIASFYDLGLEAPIGCDDVDVLCPQDFFDETVERITSLEDTSKVQVRWPRGRLRERGATNLSIDIFPSEGSRILPFTAAVDMSDLFLPTSYDSVRDIAETVCGRTYVPTQYILRWLAVIGREKDIEAVETILPAAIEAHIVTEQEREDILHEVSETLRNRELYPERYYPRVV